MNVRLSNPDASRRWHSQAAAPRLTSDHVLVWRATTDRPPLSLSRLGEMLSPDEIVRAGHFKFPQHRHRFIAVHAILRMMLAPLVDAPPHEIELSRGPQGKPQLGNAQFGTGLRFNISHSGDVALFAFALEREVGVDVEVLRTIDDAAQLARRFFSPDEAAQLEREPASNRSAAFLRLWTCKEACVKAFGAGLTFPLDCIAIRSSAVAKSADWALHPIPQSEGIVGATVVAGSDCEVSFLDFSTDGTARF
jgi:4'-phosphopantetheinyl transferase